MALDELIGRLEAATEPSRELDAEIAATLRIVPEFDPGIFLKEAILRYSAGEDGRVTVYASVPGHPEMPRHSRMSALFTGSVDAAMTLIPTGAWNGQISWNFGQLNQGGFVELNLANPAWLVPGYDYSEPPHDHAVCVSSYDAEDESGSLPKPKPLPIAICITALRARQREGNVP